jgi:hypothetical protein
MGRGEEGSAAARGEEGFRVPPWMTKAMVGEAETSLRERSPEEVYWADTLLVGPSTQMSLLKDKLAEISIYDFRNKSGHPIKPRHPLTL